MKPLEGKGAMATGPSSGIGLTAITVEATCDWARAIIEGNNHVFVAPPDGHAETAESARVGKLLLERTESNGEEIGIWRSVGAQDTVTVRGYVATDQPYLVIKLGHGDDGWVRISSPIDSVTNAVNSGDGQNFVSCKLALTAAAKKELDAEKKRAAAGGKARGRVSAKLR